MVKLIIYKPIGSAIHPINNSQLKYYIMMFHQSRDNILIICLFLASATGLLLIALINPSSPFGRFSAITQVAEGKTVYAYGNGQLLASQGSDNQIKYYINDHLGSVRKITSSDGNVVSGNDYIAFGSVKSQSGNSRFRFTGKELDESGLYYYGARYYDPATGRFITTDSVKGSLKDPQSLNRYSYTMNNPLKYIDPTGEVVKYSDAFLKGLKSKGIDVSYVSKLSALDRLVRSKDVFFFRAASESNQHPGVNWEKTMGLTEHHSPQTRYVKFEKVGKEGDVTKEMVIETIIHESIHDPQKAGNLFIGLAKIADAQNPDPRFAKNLVNAIAKTATDAEEIRTLYLTAIELNSFGGDSFKKRSNLEMKGIYEYALGELIFDLGVLGSLGIETSNIKNEIGNFWQESGVPNYLR